MSELSERQARGGAVGRKNQRNLKKLLTGESRCGIISRSPKATRQGWREDEKSFEKTFRNLLTNQKRSDIIYKLSRETADKHKAP